MAIRVYKPTTAGRRNASVSDFSELTRSTPEKSLVRKKSKTGGRNSYGRITSRHRGGGHKRQYRLIDFKRWDKDGVPAKVAEIEYDPNRSARIALLHFYRFLQNDRTGIRSLIHKMHGGTCDFDSAGKCTFMHFQPIISGSTERRN